MKTKSRMGIILLMTAVIAIVSLSSACTRLSPTELTEENLPVKVLVCGYARIIPLDDLGKFDDPICVKDLAVNIFYGLPDDEGNVVYSRTEVVTDRNGYFEREIGCPAGKALKVKVTGRTKDDTFAREEGSSDYQETEAYFYKEVEKSVAAGEAAYFALDMVPVANVGEDGFQNK